MWLWIYYDCACYLMLKWERDSKKKEKIKIGQEYQMLELTFNFPRALPILTFYENELTLFTEKNKENKSKRKKIRERKIEVKRGERKERKKKREKLYVWTPMSEKSILSDLLKTYLLIPLFTN